MLMAPANNDAETPLGQSAAGDLTLMSKSHTKGDKTMTKLFECPGAGYTITIDSKHPLS